MPNNELTGAELGGNTDNDETNTLGDDSGIFFAETLLEFAINRIGQVEIEPKFKPFVATRAPSSNKAQDGIAHVRPIPGRGLLDAKTRIL